MVKGFTAHILWKLRWLSGPSSCLRQGHGWAISSTRDSDKGLASASSAQWVLLFCNYQKIAVKMKSVLRSGELEYEITWQRQRRGTRTDSEKQDCSSARKWSFSSVNISQLEQFILTKEHLWNGAGSFVLPGAGVCDHRATLVSGPRVPTAAWSDALLENPSLGVNRDHFCGVSFPATWCREAFDKWWWQV